VPIPEVAAEGTRYSTRSPAPPGFDEYFAFRLLPLRQFGRGRSAEGAMRLSSRLSLVLAEFIAMVSVTSWPAIEMEVLLDGPAWPIH
jgi:hypothetical protein